jgi:hypothetical protein
VPLITGSRPGPTALSGEGHTRQVQGAPHLRYVPLITGSRPDPAGRSGEGHTQQPEPTHTCATCP